MSAPELAALQRDFANALFEDASAVPDGVTSHSAAYPARRFHIYRNTVFAGLIETVRARFPAVERVVGEEFFRAMARIFVEAHPPRSPALLHYGEDFIAFLAEFEPAAELPYLPDVARLEWLRNRAYHARDAEPLNPGALASVVPERLADVRLAMHPSAQLFASDWPAVSIWEANAGDGDGSLAGELGPEAALILRPRLEVLVLRLDAGGHALAEALAAGLPLGEAADRAQTAAPDFSLPNALAAVLRAGAFSDLSITPAPPSTAP